MPTAAGVRRRGRENLFAAPKPSADVAEPAPRAAPATPHWTAAPATASAPRRPGTAARRSARHRRRRTGRPPSQQLELARAYLDLGDDDAARALLREVLDGRDPAARDTAAQMLREL